MHLRQNGTQQNGHPIINSNNVDELSRNEEDVTEEETVSPPVPTEGGYGWVVLAAAFLINALIEGVCTCYGVFLPILLDYYQEPRWKMSLAAALQAGCFTLAGPFAGGLVNRFGCRTVAVVGGILSSAGLILSTLSSHVNLFIVFYGPVSGLGLGLMYLPATVMVSFYFHQKRGIATGISYSGAGIGMVVMAPLTAALVEHFDWKNAVRFIACITLQGTVLGALLRPAELSTGLTRELKVVDCSEEISSPMDCDMPTLDDSPMLYKTSHFRERLHSVHSTWSFPTHSLLRSKTEQQNTPELTTERSPAITKSKSLMQSPIQNGVHKSVTIDPAHKTCHTMHGHKNDPKTVFSKSCHELRYSLPGQENFIRKPTHLFLNPLSQVDIFYCGSLKHLSSTQSFKSHITSVSSIKDATIAEDVQSISDRPTVKEFIWKVFQFSLITNPCFLVILSGSVLIQLGYFVPIMYITEYAVSHKIPHDKAALLLSIMGLCNSVGRASLGAVANIRKVKVLHVHNVCLMIAGILTISVVLIKPNFATLAVYMALWGYFIASFVPLATIFLVEYLGIEQLTNSFGILSLIRGLSSMSGPPIAGVLIDYTGSMAYAFYFAGVMFFVSGFIHYLLPLVRNLPAGSSSKL